MNKIHMICARKKKHQSEIYFENWCEMFYTVKKEEGKKRMKSEKCLVNCLWVCEKHIFLSNVKSMIYIFEDDQQQYEKVWKSMKSMKAAMMIFQFCYKTNMLQSDYYEVCYSCFS